MDPLLWDIDQWFGAINNLWKLEGLSSRSKNESDSVKEASLKAAKALEKKKNGRCKN